MRLLLFFFIAVVVIGSGGHLMNYLFGVLFESVGKDILSSCSGVVFLMTRKVYVTVGFLRQNRRRSK
jgi:hypothetical protein